MLCPLQHSCKHEKTGNISNSTCNCNETWGERSENEGKTKSMNGRKLLWHFVLTTLILTDTICPLLFLKRMMNGIQTCSPAAAKYEVDAYPSNRKDNKDLSRCNHTEGSHEQWKSYLQTSDSSHFVNNGPQNKFSETYGTRWKKEHSGDQLLRIVIISETGITGCKLIEGRW